MAGRFDPHALWSEHRLTRTPSSSEVSHVSETHWFYPDRPAVARRAVGPGDGTPRPLNTCALEDRCFFLRCYRNPDFGSTAGQSRRRLQPRCEPARRAGTRSARESLLGVKPAWQVLRGAGSLLDTPDTTRPPHSESSTRYSKHGNDSRAEDKLGWHVKAGTGSDWAAVLVARRPAPLPRARQELWFIPSRRIPTAVTRSSRP